MCVAGSCTSACFAQVMIICIIPDGFGLRLNYLTPSRPFEFWPKGQNFIQLLDLHKI